jgi:prepilin-type N-terminal cleavage/methylation domain-containing protein
MKRLSLTSQPRTAAGFTLVEMMVATAISLLLAMAVIALSVYSARAFAGMANYTDLDLHSRNALDVIGKDLRQATAVVASQTNSSVNYLTLTNEIAGTGTKLTFDANARTLVMERTGQPALTCLTDCDTWTFALYNRAPAMSSTNILFYPAIGLSDCKLVNLSWKCSRTILGNRINTESVQTAQIVLRNKVR